MNISVIYGFWPNRPLGMNWCDLPWLLRDAGLAAKLLEAGHQVEEIVSVGHGLDAGDLTGGLRVAGEIGAHIRAATARGSLPVIICGSCCIAAIGAITGLGGEGTRIAWLDAHPDLNTPDTSRSCLIEGMALAMATGLCWNAALAMVPGFVPATPGNVMLFGAREIDPPEKALLARHGIPIAQSPNDVTNAIGSTGPVYIHLDMDVHDALTVRSNRFAAIGGPTQAEIRTVFETLPKDAVLSVTGLDPAAPDADTGAQIAIDHVIAFASARSSGQ